MRRTVAYVRHSNCFFIIFFGGTGISQSLESFLVDCTEAVFPFKYSSEEKWKMQ